MSKGGLRPLGGPKRGSLNRGHVGRFLTITSAGWRRMTSFAYALRMSAISGGIAICGVDERRGWPVDAWLVLGRHAHRRAPPGGLSRMSGQGRGMTACAMGPSPAPRSRWARHPSAPWWPLPRGPSTETRPLVTRGQKLYAMDQQAPQRRAYVPYCWRTHKHDARRAFLC